MFLGEKWVFEGAPARSGVGVGRWVIGAFFRVIVRVSCARLVEYVLKEVF